MHQNERRDGERNQPGIDLPEGKCRDAERGEHEVGREMLDLEQPGLAERMSAGEVEHQREHCVVDRDEDDAADEAGDRDTQRVVADHTPPDDPV